ncbi:hypothetical protein KFL_009680020 [Klebsormidium nitens]|uniref:Uncharacterized protein n=1 Tax=Klebsormidium nitens TaxID=105231 RepID=A0A1Y1IN26_KLENI|nr:hypothetical protein KFL_009680020 [Klebsormidium nitens]|eukprot:GAQ92290.1 hypothetical protein KFL_009680020 [Klebsormidium nitens]
MEGKGGASSANLGDETKLQKAQEKAVWAKTMQNLQLRLKAHEREMEILYSGKASTGNEELQRIAEAVKEAAVARQRLDERMADRLERVQSDVRTLQTLVSNIRTGPEYMDELARTMDASEADISALKEEQQDSYDTLCRHERVLSKEIDGFGSRLESWDRGPSSPEALPARTRSAPLGGRSKGAKEGGGLLPEVEEYEEFVERTGLMGGWDPVDHKRFLRILAEHGGDYSLSVQPAVAELLLFDRKEIIAHCRWHAEFEELAKRKRGAIMAWRAQKEEEKAAAVTAGLLQSTSVKKSEEERDEAERAAERERQRKRAQLQQWKAEKEAAERERRDAEAAAEAQAQSGAKEAEQRKKAQLREAVAVFKEKQKQAEEERQRTAEEEEERRKREASGIEAELRRRRERDLAAVYERRASEQDRVQQEQQQKEARLERLRRPVQIVVDRDPHRLLKETASLINRKSPQGEEESKLFVDKVVNVRYHQTKALPTWRQVEN